MIKNKFIKPIAALGAVGLAAGQAFAVGAVPTEAQGLLDDGTVTIAAVLVAGLAAVSAKFVLRIGKKVVAWVTGSM